MQSTKQAIFRLGEEEYGLDILDVNIIENYVSTIQVSNGPSNVMGVVRLRGEIIPVYSLRAKFNLAEKTPDEETRLVLTTSNDILIAYEVDMIEEIIMMESNHLYEVSPVLKSSETKYVKMIANVDGRIILLLDANGILSEVEQKQIKDMIDRIKLEDQKEEEKKQKEKEAKKKAKEKNEKIEVTIA